MTRNVLVALVLPLNMAAIVVMWIPLVTVEVSA